MKLLKNSGQDRVLDVLRSIMLPGSAIDFASAEVSLFAFSEIRDLLAKSTECRFIVPDPMRSDLGFLGNELDRGSRNKLQSRWLAKLCSDWIGAKCEVHQTSGSLPQSTIVVKHAGSGRQHAITGTCPMSTAGFGLTPGNQFGMIQYAESAEEASVLGGWFSQLWSNTTNGVVKDNLIARFRELTDHREPETAYYLGLANVFAHVGDELDEDRIVKTATGIKDTLTWKKLFRFQRDGVVGAIDKLERFGGCIDRKSVV